MTFEKAEYTFNAVGFANGDLEVSPFVKARPWIDWLAFKKHPFDSIDGFPAGLLYDAVDAPYNSAIEMASKQIFAVSREFESGSFGGFNETRVGGADQVNASAGREVETLT